MKIRVRETVRGIISWNGFYYGYTQRRNSSNRRYYKSKNTRFDETCGGTEECTEEEYNRCAKKYREIFN